MKKYMGNKSRILPNIYEAAQFAPDKCTIFDAFSGTTNVGQFFKSKGYKVISNDVNATSRLLGQVYLCLNSIPSFETLFSSSCYSIDRLKCLIQNDEFNASKRHFISLNHNTNNENYLLENIDTNAFNLLVYLSFYADEHDYSSDNYNYKLLAPDFIWRNFCLKGTNSDYFNLVSQKSIMSQVETLKKYESKFGTDKITSKAIDMLEEIYVPPFKINNLNAVINLLENNLTNLNSSSLISTVIKKLTSLSKRNNHIGKRMFFSEEHGHKIDTINNLSLLWRKDGLINESEYNFIQCSLIEATALFSNTSATYQAFYKTYKANTQQEFRLVFPEIITSDLEHTVYCDDTFDIISKIKEPYDILYLDPPYNWRIYDSNYHLLNLLSDYYNIADNILKYEEGIAGAAGENRNLIREYTNYNRRNTFEDLLFKLIEAAKCKYIIISYSDSLSNHNKNSRSSIDKIEAFLNDTSIFVAGSYEKIEVDSVNFESRKSERKEDIHELLFVVEKRLDNISDSALMV